MTLHTFPKTINKNDYLSVEVPFNDVLILLSFSSMHVEEIAFFPKDRNCYVFFIRRRMERERS